MFSTKMSISTILLVWSVLIAGIFSASFDNIQTPFSALSSRDGSFRVVPSKTTRSVDAPPVQLCGFRLLEAVRGLCGGYFSGYSRRSDPAMPIGGGMMEEMAMRDSAANPMDLNSENVPQYSFGDVYVDGASSDYPETENNWSRSSKGLALKVLTEGKSHPRFRRNIIDECCKRPCTVTHMLKYCGRT